MHFTTKKVFLCFIGFLIILSLVMSPGAAVKVEGAKIMLDVKPNTNYIFPMAISTKSDDTPSDYAVDVYGFGQSADGGSYIPLESADDTGVYSARALVTVESSLIHVDPGERKAFNATISIPEDSGEGGRYAIIHIHPAASASGQTGFATAIIVPVMLTIKDSKLIETGTITDINIGVIEAGKPIMVSTTLKNTGNHHYYGVINQITVTDAAGTIKAIAKANPMSNAVIPGNSVRFDAPLETSLTAGTYSIKSDMMLESGARLDSASTRVTVEETYIPPFQESSMKVGPDNPSTIVVPEGTIIVSIPRGAVLEETLLSVKPYTENLPQLPAGAVEGSTAFSIDGLSGLLTQDATVTVKYNQEDLDAAGGKAENLVIGRFDRLEGSWTLLPTTVDTNAMTLTTRTNRFSIWAVIASDQPQDTSVTAPEAPKQSPGPDPIAICGVSGATLGLLAYRTRKNI